MITAVDSNVLFDVFLADPEFGDSSATALRDSLRCGRIVVCGAVVAEVTALFPTREEAITALSDIGVHFDSGNYETALMAGRYWHEYRQHRGKKRRIVADFLIGAHASCCGERLLTRDAGFYREYFEGLEVVNPVEEYS